MISLINGLVKATSTQQVFIDVGPLEFTLHVPDSTAYHIGTPTALHVHMHWNAENGPSFYGFQTPLDRTVFTLIISCSGIGPKIGLAILAHLGAHTIIESIQRGNIDTLSSVNGVGKKKAEQLIMHLKHKISTLLSDKTLNLQSNTLEQWHTINLTLESLNYSRPEIAQAMDHIKTASQQYNLSFDQLLRKALTFLSK